MKIAHITQFFHPERGYQENFIAKYNSKRGLETYIICSNDLLPWGNEVNSKPWQATADRKFSKLNNVSIIRLNILFQYSKRLFMVGVYRSLNMINPDIVFIHGVSLPLCFISLFWATVKRKRIIIDDHMVKAGVKNPYSDLFHEIFIPVFRLFRNIVGVKIDKWIGVCVEAAEFIRDKFGVEDIIHVIHLGYDSDSVYFDPKAGLEWKEEKEIPHDKKIVLYIGKLDKFKNPIDLIKPFKILSNQYENYNLLFVGDTSAAYKKKIVKLADELDILNRIHIRQSVKNNEMRKVFSATDLVIWPHGSSMAMIEAMACKCPVIASECQVNKERLGEGRGVLYKESSDEELITAIEYAINNKSSIVNSAFNWVKEFSWDKLEKETMNLIL